MQSHLPWRIFSLLSLVLFAFPLRALAQADTLSLIQKMAANEQLAEQHRDRFLYTSTERSERTGGHLWTERVADIEAGKIRLLIAEDGQPLSAERQAAERARLAEIAAHPDAFAKREQALKNDEHHAREILALLPKAFLFDPPQKQGALTRLAFRPNPDYSPQSMEERVLHAMTGTLLIDPTVRLRHIEGRLPEDVNIGFGLLATIKAGSNFALTRERVPGLSPTADDWKTSILDTDINGRALFFKTVGKKEHAEHTGFKPLPSDITVPQAIAALLP